MASRDNEMYSMQKGNLLSHALGGLMDRIGKEDGEKSVYTCYEENLI